MLLGLIGWVLPPSRMPAAGTSAPEPDSTWPLAQPSSRTFGRYPEHAGCLGCSDGHQRTPRAVGRTSTHECPGPEAAGLGLGRSTDLLVPGGSGASPRPGATPGPDLDWPGATPAAATRGARGPRPPAVATHAPAPRGCGLLRHVA